MGDSIGQYAALAAVAVAIVLVFRWGKKRRGEISKAASQAGGPSTLSEHQRLQRAVEKLQVNLMEFSREVEGRLDTRIRTLTQLVSDADERIKKLEELQDKTPARKKEIPELHKDVYRLADEGFDEVEIARRTSTTPGEVGLILGLRRTRGG